jgi:Tfp pilus assembly protein PilF
MSGLTNTFDLARRAAVLLVALAVLAGAPGCSVRTNNPYEPPRAADRNPLRAQELTLQAADLIDADPTKAEELLREALTADLFHGPAHNNLGVIYLKRGELYEAAHEFEWARKLMPGNPDPRMNLALTLERAGHVDDALAAYASALEVSPLHIPTLQALTRLQIRHNRADDRTQERLKEVALRGETEEWREWARYQIARPPTP